jgi:hypothetical protein
MEKEEKEGEIEEDRENMKRKKRKMKTEIQDKKNQEIQIYVTHTNRSPTPLTPTLPCSRVRRRQVFIIIIVITITTVPIVLILGLIRVFTATPILIFPCFLRFVFLSAFNIPNTHEHRRPARPAMSEETPPFTPRTDSNEDAAVHILLFLLGRILHLVRVLLRNLRHIRVPRVDVRIWYISILFIIAILVQERHGAPEFIVQRQTALQCWFRLRLGLGLGLFRLTLALTRSRGARPRGRPTSGSRRRRAFAQRCRWEKEGGSFVMPSLFLHLSFTIPFNRNIRLPAYTRRVPRRPIANARASPTSARSRTSPRHHPSWGAGPPW